LIKKALDVARGLSDSLFVFHKRDAHKIVSILAKSDPRGYGDVGFPYQYL
jgi:hypothetical protein